MGPAARRQSRARPCPMLLVASAHHGAARRRSRSAPLSPPRPDSRQHRHFDADRRRHADSEFTPTARWPWCKMPRRSRMNSCPAINGSAGSGKQRSWARFCWAWSLPRRVTAMTGAHRESAEPRRNSTTRFANMGVTAGRLRSAGANLIAFATNAIAAAGSSPLHSITRHRGSNRHRSAFPAALLVRCSINLTFRSWQTFTTGFSSR